MQTLHIALIVIGLVILGLIIFLEINRRKLQKEERSWMDIKNETSGDPLDSNEDEDLTDEEIIYPAEEELYLETEDPEQPDYKPEPEATEEPAEETFINETTSEVESASEPVETLDSESEQTIKADTVEGQQVFDFVEDNQVQANQDEQAPIKTAPLTEDDSFKSKYSEVYVLTVMAKEDDYFEGADLLREFTALNLKFGQDNLYHRPMPGRSDINLFSIANIMQPGDFEPKKMLDFKTKGLLLFLPLPGKLEPVQAFDQFYDAADALAVTLDGLICDEHRNALSQHRLEQLRDKIRHLELKLELERKKAGKS